MIYNKTTINQSSNEVALYMHTQQLTKYDRSEPTINAELAASRPRTSTSKMCQG